MSGASVLTVCLCGQYCCSLEQKQGTLIFWCHYSRCFSSKQYTCALERILGFASHLGAQTRKFSAHAVNFFYSEAWWLDVWMQHLAQTTKQTRKSIEEFLGEIHIRQGRLSVIFFYVLLAALNRGSSLLSTFQLSIQRVFAFFCQPSTRTLEKYFLN